MTRRRYYKDINRVVLVDGKTVADWKMIARHMTNQQQFPTYTHALDWVAQTLYGSEYVWTTLAVKLKQDHGIAK